MPSIFDFPDIYDAVLRSPLSQIEAETRSVRKLLADRGIEGGRLLEIACGTCTHGILLAGQGFDVAGIDLSPNMVDAAASRGAAAGVSLDVFQGDITDFELDTDPFDAAIFMAETFPIITEYEAIASHFGCVRRALRPGGVYIVDIDAHRAGVRESYGVWGERTVQVGDTRVEIWHEDFPGDFVGGVSRLVMHCRIHDDGDVHETRDDWHIRQYNPWHLSVLVRTLGGWRLSGFYSRGDASPDIADEPGFLLTLEAV
ncbi:class I SAM-dependent methyltransferase [Candidatus Poribacteria bacterium]|jgi:SAM-dependent methyltransferase|nr:class I SAM-dependent methyltransferase [Candidatus Poribacteria bacterium]MBT5710628.1 class I SAM-dependent methyltransferase [Candidatus Poribacteria bacterium]MBT7098763.1 class I SAM-dependent methyltransferase [Candidatus Poribacteria bacterium]MBT7807121.1 class I SAM-dependent methyltransferase [Candidatus Poribacteria bacterium]